MITNKKKLLQALLYTSIIISLLTPIVIISVHELVFQKRIYPFIKINDLNVSGLLPEKAEKELEKKIRQKEKPAATFSFQDKAWSFLLADFGLSFQPEETIKKAYNFGRGKNILNNLKEKWQLWQKPLQIDLMITFDEEIFKEKVSTMTAVLDKPAVPPQIKLAQGVILMEKGVAGEEINKEKLKNNFVKKVSGLDFSDVVLEREMTINKITDEMVEKTKKRAEKFINKKIELIFKDKRWEIKDQELITFLDFDNGFDQEKIKSYTEALAKEIDLLPQDALFNFQNGRVLEFRASSDGQELDQDKTREMLKKALEALELTDAQAEINLAVILEKPKITMENVNDLGIRELIGKGESYFKGSSSARVDNIKLASSKLNGLLVKPGESFSFNQALGEVSKTTGYKEAYIIKEGKTVLGDGGGVCQVSTTLFRAVLNTGLAVEERQAHAYRVYFYEQGSQVGLDATVFEPSPDFKFKNDTKNHLLIQTSLDKSYQKLTFYFYGTGDGRQVLISKSKILDQVSPAPDKYIDDPSLPAGTVKQIDFSAWGAKVSFDWQVTRGDEVLQERTFYSNYRPWQAVFLRGTR